MEESAPKIPREHVSHDIKCLDCGVYNLPENIVCGACGASLAVIFDRDGKVFRWESDSPYWDRHQKLQTEGPGPHPAASFGGRILAVLVLFTFLVLLARRFDFGGPIVFIVVLMALIVTVRLFLYPSDK